MRAWPFVLVGFVTALGATEGCRSSIPDDEGAQAVKICHYVRPTGSKIKRRMCADDWAARGLQPRNPGTRPAFEREDMLERGLSP